MVTRQIGLVLLAVTAIMFAIVWLGRAPDDRVGRGRFGGSAHESRAVPERGGAVTRRSLVAHRQLVPVSPRSAQNDNAQKELPTTEAGGPSPREMEIDGRYRTGLVNMLMMRPSALSVDAIEFSQEGNPRHVEYSATQKSALRSFLESRLPDLIEFERAMSTRRHAEMLESVKSGSLLRDFDDPLAALSEEERAKLIEGAGRARGSAGPPSRATLASAYVRTHPRHVLLRTGNTAHVASIADLPLARRDMEIAWTDRLVLAQDLFAWMKNEGFIRWQEAEDLTRRCFACDVETSCGR